MSVDWKNCITIKKSIVKENGLWISKYEPVDSRCIIGNTSTIDDMRSELSSYHNNTKDLFLFLHGASGIGKSLSVRLLASELKYTLRYLEDSDDLESKLNEISVQSQTILLIDNFDLFYSNSGCVGTLVKYLKGEVCRKNRIIIIMISSNRKILPEYEKVTKYCSVSLFEYPYDIRQNMNQHQFEGSVPSTYCKNTIFISDSHASLIMNDSEYSKSMLLQNVSVFSSDTRKSLFDNYLSGPFTLQTVSRLADAFSISDFVTPDLYQDDRDARDKDKVEDSFFYCEIPHYISIGAFIIAERKICISSKRVSSKTPKLVKKKKKCLDTDFYTNFIEKCKKKEKV